eukprot:jgi/Chlat1/1767/Chrsp134S02119
MAAAAAAVVSVGRAAATSGQLAALCGADAQSLRRRPAARPAVVGAGVAPVRCAAPSSSAAGEDGGVAAAERVDTKAFRRSLNKSGTYNRQGFGYKKEILEMMGSEYQSSMVQMLKDNNMVLTVGDVTIKLAKAYGFCWGVERAVQIAYEARKHFPTEQIWITNEIIHNPDVNKRIQDMGVKYIPVDSGVKDFQVVGDGNVVILPAFGASMQEMQTLNEKGVQIVDTTCPWVSKVWNTVEKHKKKTYTSVIHGKYAHEETVATASFAGDYLIVKNIAEMLMRFGLLQKFSKAISEGFDPDVHLERVGIANQTTMLKGETETIGKMLEKTMIDKYGPVELNEHFMSFNTICDATQERQDAMYELVEDDLDLMLVIGGFNSSNTSHLQEIAEDKKIPSYWIDGASRVGPGNHIQHLLMHGELVETADWLPQGPVTIGITSGASTPDKAIEEVLDKVFTIKEGLQQSLVPA